MSRKTPFPLEARQNKFWCSLNGWWFPFPQRLMPLRNNLGERLKIGSKSAGESEVMNLRPAIDF